MRTFKYSLDFQKSMILPETIKAVVQKQRQELASVEKGVPRLLLSSIDTAVPHAAIISGVRRCGKSTLLKQMMAKSKGCCYFNFEDARLTGFTATDLEKMKKVLEEEHGTCARYFLDEIQNVPGWERFVRTMQDEGKQFVITGSNASLLSRELGTKLTGRHITYELFPFSYSEMLHFFSKKPSEKSFAEYLERGGFPEFLKYEKTSILQELFTDVITRDIIVRHGLRDPKTVREMAIFLITNGGKEFSYNKLKEFFKLGSMNTARAYVAYFEDSYLLFTVPRFDFSFKKQIIAPKKAYSIDCGFAAANSASFSADKGRMLENSIFLGLRRKHKEIFYFKSKGECDFLVKDKGKISMAIQVCYELTEENKERELNGLKEAMRLCQLPQGTIVTFKQEDSMPNIKIVPAWKWLLEIEME